MFRFATMVNNIGVSLELVITVGATAVIAIIAFSAPENHQPISVLFTGGESGDKDSYMLAWLAAALGPFFGLIGVESGADVAEETKDARRVVPKTMFYALVTSIVIDLLMYIVYVLAIKDVAAVEANAAAPMDGDHQPSRPAPSSRRSLSPLPLTNILACLLANILVATRLTYSMARDNMLPFSHIWRHVSAETRKTPAYSILGLGVLSTLLLLSALVNEKAFNFIIGIASLLFFFVYILQAVRPAGWASRKGTIPAPGARHLGLGEIPAARLRHRAGRVPRCRRGAGLPAAVHHQQMGVPRHRGDRRDLVGHRPEIPPRPRRSRRAHTPSPTTSEINQRLINQRTSEGI